MFFQIPFFTFIPISFSSKGRQYIGTGTGTVVLLGVSLLVGGVNLAGKLQP